MSIPGAAFFKNHKSHPAWRRLLFASLFALPAILCFSQTHNNRPLFERIGEREGLPNSNISISGISQDGQGFLWFCTSEGLHRYDGRRFKTWKSDPTDPDGLSERHLIRFLIDRSGRHWALGGGGVLHLLDPSTERFRRFPLWFSEKEKAPPIVVRCLLEDRQGRLWMGTDGHGLCLLDPASGKLERQVLQTGTDREYVADMEMDAAGNLWVSSGETLFCLELPENEAAPPRVRPFPEIGFIAWHLLPDKSGGVWLDGGSPSEIARFDPISRRLRRYTYEVAGAQADPSNRVNALYEARDGRIWVGTNSGGISLLEPSSGKATWLRHNRHDPQSLSAHCITDIFEDKTGIVWVATWGGGGLNKYDPQAACFGRVRSVFGNPQSLGNASVNTFCEDARGIVWVGTVDGLNRFDPTTGEVRRYDLPRLFLRNDGNLIHSIAPAPRSEGERLWVGTSAGLAVFDPASGRFSRWLSTQPEGKPLENEPAYFLPKDRNGVLWAISHKGIYRLFRFDAQAGAFRPSEVLDSLNALQDAAGDRDPIVCADRQHNVWIGTENKGFFRFDLTAQQLTHFTVDASDTTGFPTLTPGHALLDRKNRQWFGTDKGLYLLLPGERGAPARFRRFTEREGLPSNSIQGMLEDEQGHIWVSTFNGLCRFDPEFSGQAPDKLTFRNYGRSDGLQGNEFSHEACFRAADGTLYFGGVNGFNAFSPGDIRDDTVAPQVAFTAVKVLRDNEMQDMPTQLPLRLTHRDRVLTFEFAALHFADPERNQFAWKMEGFDPDWRYGGSQNEATYTNLDPGSYTFRVKAANKDGIWNEEDISLKIRVLPPWWKAWWAWLLYGAALVSGLYFYFKFRLERQAEQAEALRIKELDSFKSRLYTNLTHEFRTPLTVILGMTGQIKNDPDKYLAEGTRLIETNGKNLLHLINQLLDLSKLENKSFNLHLQQGDIVPYLRYVTESFQTYANSRNLSLRFYSGPESLEMDYDPEQIKQVLTNLISNAVKFTPSGGEVSVRIKEQQGQLCVEVKDTGIGISKEDLPHVFDRFYQVDASHTRAGEGTGIGLAHTQELVKVMGGDIGVESDLGKGSTFFVNLPITRNAPVNQGLLNLESLVNLPENGLESHATAFPITNPQSTNPQLLIIEDNPDVVVYLKSCLEGLYNLDVAFNGKIGIEKALENIPDLIISDVMMPEKDGYQVCDTLKNDERTSHIPIILLTAKADAASKIAGLRRGAEAYLSKPFDKEELLVWLEKLLERQRRLATYFSKKIHDGGEATLPEAAMQEAIGVEDIFIQKIRQIIAENFGDEDFGLPQLCQKVGMSRSQLFRKMKALIDESPSDFIRSHRLNEAKRLLETTGLNVSEVAWKVGYKDLAHFSKSFQEAFGVLPSATNK